MPLFRLLGKAGDTFYTKDPDERDHAITIGYEPQADLCVVFDDDAVPGTLPLLRMVRLTQGCDRYWTADHGDANDMQATYGYAFDPVPCGWVFDDGSSAGRWAQPDVDDPSVPDKTRALTATEPLYRLLA